MAMRVQWFAVALCTLLWLLACEESKVPPPAPSAPQGPSAGRSGTTAGTAGSSSKPSTGPGTRSRDRDAGRRDDDTLDDAGTADDSDDGDAGSEPVVDAGMVESWAGTTSQGLVIAFDVAEAGLTQIRIEYSGFGCDGDNSTHFSPPLPLGEQFSVEFALAGATSVTFAGSFTDDDNASGTLSFMSTPTPGQPMCGFGVLTWTAMRGAVP
jgi:hypothetical protein